jgi:hypothetical protein
MPFLASIEGQFAFGRQPASTQSPYNPQVYTSNLQIWVDAGSNASYPGSGTVWSNLVAANAASYWYNLSNSPSVSTIVFNSTSNSTLFFDGINDYATPNTSLVTLVQANTWNETREYWLYWPGTPGCLTMESGAVTPDTSWFDAQASVSNANLVFSVWQGNVSMTPYIITNSLGSNRWNHIVWQHNKSSNLLMGYVNGALLYNSTVARTTPDSVGSGFFPILMAGSSTNFGYGSASYLRGSLAVYRWYNQILTGEQISSNFNAERTRFGVSQAAPNSDVSILAFARSLAGTFSGQTITPTAGGALTINSAAVGNYEYAVAGTTTISVFNSADWFSSTKDTVSSWIIINGNLTIDAGQTFIPSVRKLFTVIYVTGDLVCNGTISMTARGANHSGTGDSGGATTAVDIRIGTGTFSAVVNPQIPAAGGAGAPAKTVSGSNSGSAGANGGTGGGGTGEAFQAAGVASAGSAGTCFSGGCGSGGAFNATSGAGGANGGAGGAGVGTIAGGGSGNPGGAGSGSSGVVGNSGTGGSLIIIVAGALSGSGTIVSNGVNGARPSGSPGGGASGGGSVTVLFGSNPGSAVTVTANGGLGQASGNGGAGTARKLAIGAN